MPAKKIKVIALDTPANEETAAEAPTESQGMDEVINDIQADSNNTNLEESTVEVSVPEPKAKAKAKREPKKAAKEPPAPAPTPEPAQEVKAEPVADAKETCPDCGKSVSAKTLKYSYKANCKALKPKVVQPYTDSLYSGMFDDPNPVGRDERLQNRFENIASRMRYDKQSRLEQKLQRIAKLTSQIFWFSDSVL